MIRLLLISFAILSSGFLFSQNKDSLKVGDIAPSFSSTDQYGSIISSDSLLKNGKIVVVFYRGTWCPYCKKHLSNLQDSLKQIRLKGATLIVITPESRYSTRKTIYKTKAQFSILCDNEFKIMESYYVSYKISKETVPRYLPFVKKRARWANKNKEDTLPIPATFVINQDGKIAFKHLNRDYTKRSSVKEILTYL